MLMSPPSTTEILNRLLVLHERSLPMYLSYAPPHRACAAIRKAKAVLDQIVDDQKRTVDRLATIILDSNGIVEHGEFPMSFTSLHDLSLAYLLKLMIERQEKIDRRLRAAGRRARAWPPTPRPPPAKPSAKRRGIWRTCRSCRPRWRRSQ